MNRSERGLVIGWVTRLSEKLLDLSGTVGNLKIPSMRREMGKTPAPSKPQFGSVIPPEGKKKTTGVLSPGNSYIITICEPATLGFEYATLRRRSIYVNNDDFVKCYDIWFSSKKHHRSAIIYFV